METLNRAFPPSTHLISEPECCDSKWATVTALDAKLTTACVCGGMTGCLVSKGPILNVNDWFCAADTVPNRSAYRLDASFEKSISISFSNFTTNPQ